MTMTINKEDLIFLKNLQQELLTQDNDGQAAPRFWTILNYRYVAAHPGTHDRVSLYFSGDCERTTLEDYVKRILDEEGENIPEAIEELNDLWDGLFSDADDILQWIHEYKTEEVELVYEKLESFVAQDVLFLTKEEANTHLQLNHYHYHEKAHTYAMTAWRAPKVAKLLTILQEFDWDSIVPIEEVEEMEEMEEMEEHEEQYDGEGILCVYINRENFLNALHIEAFASFILPLEWQHETIESVVEQAKLVEYMGYSDDLEEFNAEAFIALLEEHDISYWTDIQ